MHHFPIKSTGWFVGCKFAWKSRPKFDDDDGDFDWWTLMADMARGETLEDMAIANSGSGSSIAQICVYIYIFFKRSCF